MMSASGSTMRKPSTRPRPSRRSRDGRKVSDSGNPVKVSRAGNSSGGEPIQVWPDAISSFCGVRVWTPMSMSSGTTAPSGT